MAFAPLTGVSALYEKPSQLPLLLDATAEELTLGLEAGNFTSVDLVNVSFSGNVYSETHQATDFQPGVRGPHIASQLNPSHGYGT